MCYCYRPQGDVGVSTSLSTEGPSAQRTHSTSNRVGGSSVTAVRRKLIKLGPAALVTATFVVMASFVAWRFEVFKSPVSGYPAAPASDGASESIVAPRSQPMDVTRRPARPAPSESRSGAHTVREEPVAALPAEVPSPSTLPEPEAIAEGYPSPRHPEAQPPGRSVTVDAAPPRSEAPARTQEELRPQSPAPSRAEDSADDPSAVIDWLLKNRR